MIYLTFNDQPSGVYSSQVTDVVCYLRAQKLSDIRLVAFISVRGFLSNRKKIRSEEPRSLVLPILPRASQTWFSTIILFLYCLFTGERSVICRNVTACNMALSLQAAGLRMRIGYDGRGAIAAEWNEYEVVSSEKLKTEIAAKEQRAVIESDYRIAVSRQLVEHWKSAYGYRSENHTVIPCTVSSTFVTGIPGEDEIAALRKKYGYSPDDHVLVYSGSTAGWQSFSVLENLLSNALRSSSTVKLLFLSGKDPAIEKMKAAFPGQVESRWLRHHEVTGMLLACDTGILYREQSITNRVASPTKFAEYLSAGLPVIISAHLGDYSDFVVKEQCGQVLDDHSPISLKKVTYQERKRLNSLVEQYFTKDSQKSNYQRVIQALNIK